MLPTYGNQKMGHVTVVYVKKEDTLYQWFGFSPFYFPHLFGVPLSATRL